MNVLNNKPPEIEDKFSFYPDEIRAKMEYLRQLVIETIQESPEIGDFEETLKWGEPSFLTKHGSTLRMDWKEKHPEQVAMYFKCTSKLVDSFRNVFTDLFNYENNRAILFQLDQNIPELELKQCIRATLMYHKLKHLTNLGLKI